MGQLQAVESLVTTLKTSPVVLDYGRNIATAIVSGPHNHCAATLSALLVFVGIYPNGGGTGNRDLEPWVPSLASDLENRRGWSRITYTPQAGPSLPLQPGDVGVVMASATTHHIFLIIDPADQKVPLIADNQSTGMHPRALAGDPAANFSPTSYILRAPA